MKASVRLMAMVLLLASAGMIMTRAAFGQGPLAPSASEIDRKVTAALNQLYSDNETARDLGAKAKAVLVFPEITKGAFIVGAQYGYGALRKGPKRSAITAQAPHRMASRPASRNSDTHSSS